VSVVVKFGLVAVLRACLDYSQRLLQLTLDNHNFLASVCLLRQLDSPTC